MSPIPESEAAHRLHIVWCAEQLRRRWLPGTGAAMDAALDAVRRYVAGEGSREDMAEAIDTANRLMIREVRAGLDEKGHGSAEVAQGASACECVVRAGTEARRSITAVRNASGCVAHFLALDGNTEGLCSLSRRFNSLPDVPRQQFIALLSADQRESYLSGPPGDSCRWCVPCRTWTDGTYRYPTGERCGPGCFDNCCEERTTSLRQRMAAGPLTTVTRSSGWRKKPLRARRGPALHEEPRRRRRRKPTVTFADLPDHD